MLLGVSFFNLTTRFKSVFVYVGEGGTGVNDDFADAENSYPKDSGGIYEAPKN